MNIQTTKFVLILVVIFGLLILVIGISLKSDPDTLLKLSQSFNQIMLGIAAIVGTVGTFTLTDRYLLAREENKIKELKKKYPRSEFSKTLFVVYRQSDPGRKYMWDKRTSHPTVHHIGNRTTFTDLEFDDIRPEISLSDDEFKEIEQGERILTRGIPGT